MEKRFKTLPDIFGQATLLEVLLMPPHQMLGSMEPKERDAFMEVLENPDFSYEALSRDDAFTNVAFRHPEKGMNEYPLTPGTKGECLVGKTGYIYSMYHKEETLAKHTALTAGLMYESQFPIFSYGLLQLKEDDIVIPRPYVLCAFFHDLAKKWCACTNSSSGISSYGHAECSAYVANAWLKKTAIDDRMRQIIVTSIYGHDLIKKWSSNDTFRVKAYQEMIGGLTGDEGRPDGDTVFFPGLFSGRENRQIKHFTEMIASNDAGVKEIIFDENGKVKEYDICSEPFSKIDGDTKEHIETLSASSYKRIIDKGAGLIKAVLKDM